MSEDNLVELIADRFQQIACTKCKAQIDVRAVPVFAEIECPACGTKQLVPAQLGSFLLIGHLGTGGMASVYEAYDRTLGRRVAIKVMRLEIGTDPKLIENFFREARAAAQLNHPNVVAIYQVGQEKTFPFIVMEVLKGGRLDEYTAAGKPVGEMKLLKIALDVAKGLRAASEIQLVHGDIKPANILFDSAGNAKVADFGLARFQSKQALDKGELWGTPYYIAPEKVRQQREDQRSDIYSLGATLYHALSGHPPFEGQTARDVVVARLDRRPEPLATHRPDAAPETIALIDRMLEPDPALRYPNYASLIADINETIEKVKNRPLSTIVDRAALAGAAPRRRKRGLLIAAVAVAVLAAAGGLVALMLNRNKGTGAGAGGTASGSTNVVAAVAADTNAVPAAAATNEAAAAAPEPVQPVQPFSADDEAKIAQSLDLMAQGQNKEALALLKDWIAAAPTNHPGRPWMVVLYAMPAWLDVDIGQTRSLTRQLVDRSFPAQADGSLHPAVLPQTLARAMATVEYRDPPAGPSPWPAWYNDLALFHRAVVQMRRGDFNGARNLMGQYRQKEGTDPSWPYAFKALADRALKPLDDFEAVVNEAKTKAGDGRAQEAVKDLEAAREKFPSFFHDPLNRELAAARQALQKEKADQAVRDAAARLERVQQELDTLDTLRASMTTLIAARRFEEALVAADGAAASFTTDEGRRLFGFTREAADRLLASRRMLEDSFARTPYARARSELGGDVVGVLDNKLRIRSGGAETVKPWSAVNGRVYVDMLAYLATTRDPADKSELQLSAALYAYFNNVLPTAAGYAGLAVRADPSLRTRIHQLMPGLLDD